MPSAFGWLDTDSEQRSKMLEVVELFKEDGTVDELGIGSIRDALADSMFPGTSYQHTRLRYVLFIPWLMQLAARNAASSKTSAEFRNLEVRLITSLMEGGESLGVIGNRARGSLKRMPSGMYWTALGSWGILSTGMSSESFFRRQNALARLVERTERTRDTDSDADGSPATGLDPHLPKPPDDLLRAVTFTITPDEEQYLSDVIAESTRGSMLSWLVQHPPVDQADYVWHIDNLDEAPDQFADLVDHARRFHTVIHGANLIYNLVLARKSGRDDLVAAYEGQLRQWRDEVAATSALERWNRADWWATIGRQNPRLRGATIQFVDSWIDLLSAENDLAHSSTAAQLISNRERQIKGGRARVVNQSALDRWSGGTGLGRHDFRWRVARSHLNDLNAARKAS